MAMTKPQQVTRALGYLRVSTEEQAASGNGLDAQRSTVLAEAERRGWPVEVVADEGQSGKRVNASLRDSLDQLESGRADALIVAKMDRLARSVANAADILNAAQRQGWDLVICDLGVDLSTPAGEAMANMLATFAQYERRMISVRTKEGLAAAKAKGTRIGRPRLASAALVDRVVTARDGGQSFGSIARDLTSDGVLSPQGRPQWQSSTVRRIYNAATPSVGGGS
jgi:DNA invertase Pin-like site-specific DNA recombinase